MDNGDGIRAIIGNTPLLRLRRALPTASFRFFAKMEALNPGGSMKDRAAFNIIQRAIERGDIRNDTVVVESSSGNMGIGLAQACRFYGLPFVCVVDPKVTQQNQRLLETYGAMVEKVFEPDATSGEFLVARLRRVKELLGKYDHAFWPNQYANLDNADAHQRTMHEIVTALKAPPDYLFCAASTCGTLRGCTDYLRGCNARTTVVGVDAAGSSIFRCAPGERLIPGHGAAVRPDLYRADLVDDYVILNDMDCVVGCRRLVSTEGILMGGSSGAVFMAVRQKQETIPPDATCVAIFADRGERYLDTIYSDQWVLAKFGGIPQYLLDFAEGRSCRKAS